ncbi:MAG: hypothetical protein M3020_14665, partial [Myxococcota bacterium]|nr:hypothetical protein [Myxococcota bacterium]
FRMRSLIFVLCTSLAAIACGDDDGDDNGNNAGTGGESGEGTGGKSGQTELATVSGTITYEGEAVGPLLISLHSGFPPSMTNLVTAAPAIEDPVYPQEFTIEDVEPGTYFAVSYVSVGMFHIPAGAGDPQGAHVVDGMPAPFDVADEPVTGIDIELMDTE